MKRKIFVLDPYTNGHEAALKFMRKMGWKAKECELIFCGSHDAILESLAKEKSFAVVPVHNSTRGEITSVTAKLGALREKGYRLDPMMTIKVKVVHCLMSKPGVDSAAELSRVLSKEEALGQCDRNLNSIGLSPERRSKKDSTGGAAKAVSKMNDRSRIGAIAPKRAAKAYGLKILIDGVQDEKDNATTFELLQNELEMKSLTVGVIGIGGRFGQKLKQMFEDAGCRVIGSDKGTELSNSDVVKQADVVVLSVPIKAAPLIIRSIVRYTREDQLLMDITSVKQPAVEAMLKGKAQVLGLHPMFAPEFPMEGQTIVACPARLVEKNWKTWSVNMLARTSARIKWSEAAEHDLYMATVQSSPHLANLVNAVLIMEMGISTKESLAFTSPFYHLMFSLMGRLLSQDPDLYSAIIMKNPASVGMLEKRIKIERRFLSMIKASDRKGFKRLFLRTRAHFGEEVLRQANELFLRLNSVLRTLPGNKTAILEFDRRDNNPGLLEKVLRAFRKRSVNLKTIASADLGEKHHQFSLEFEQTRASASVTKALDDIERWTNPRMRVI